VNGGSTDAVIGNASSTPLTRVPSVCAPSTTTAPIASAAAMRITISEAGMRGMPIGARGRGISAQASSISKTASAAPSGPFSTQPLSANAQPT